MRSASLQQGLPDQFLKISALDRKACVEHWTGVFGTAPPKYLSVRFMQRVFARQLQIRILGDYPAPIRRALKVASSAARLGKPLPRSAANGSYLMREWNGRTYHVEVTASGYVLDGQTYASLSTVAQRITGAHWSGPRFFGLTDKRAS